MTPNVGCLGALVSVVAAGAAMVRDPMTADSGRRVPDDKGPLMLPGFPSEFFVYRQLAADNAAATALAFLRAWALGH